MPYIPCFGSIVTIDIFTVAMIAIAIVNVAKYLLLSIRFFITEIRIFCKGG